MATRSRPSSVKAPADKIAHGPGQLSDRTRFPRQIYPFRTVGMGLAGVAVMAVLLENHAPVSSWIWTLLSCYAWPHLAYIKATRSPQPFTSERGNLMFDSFLAGSWAALMFFNVLPAVLVVMIATADKISSGIRTLWARSLVAVVLGVVLGGMATGFALQVHTSMTVLLACLPVLAIHTIGTSMGSYRLVRRLQHQNQTLAQLSQLDVLTNLYNRRHWSNCATSLLDECRSSGRPAVLMQIDVDQFKSLNDRLGHAAGDMVLCRIADIMLAQASASAVAGRLGGDEFAFVMPADTTQGHTIAERIRRKVESISVDVPDFPGCSVSIGVASLGAAHDQLAAWMQSADEALYEAKHNGRNRVAFA